MEWDSEIIDDRPNRLIAWRSLEGSGLDNWGAVTFEPAGGGTVVRVEMGYRPPRGELGARVARLFGRVPEQQVRADLRAFKRMMESGRIAAAGDDAPEPAPQERLGQSAGR